MRHIFNRRNILLVLLICATIMALLPYVYPELFRRKDPNATGVYSDYLTRRFAEQHQAPQQAAQ